MHTALEIIVCMFGRNPAIHLPREDYTPTPSRVVAADD